MIDKNQEANSLELLIVSNFEQPQIKQNNFENIVIMINILTQRPRRLLSSGVL